MDSTAIAAIAAVLGSFIGASASIATTRIAQRTQTIREWTNRELSKRESLYEEFITEAARLIGDALEHSLDQPDPLVQLYAILSRIRLVSSEPVLAAAEECCDRIFDLYSKPNMTMEQIRTAFDKRTTFDKLDPLKAFSAACRVELHKYRLPT
jgi:hypothetical protein